MLKVPGLRKRALSTRGWIPLPGKKLRDHRMEVARKGLALLTESQNAKLEDRPLRV